jgi:hypothetical protein
LLILMIPRQPKHRTHSLPQSTASTNCYHIEHINQIGNLMKKLPYTSCICSTCGLDGRYSTRFTCKPSSCSSIPPGAHTQEALCGTTLASPDRITAPPWSLEADH